MIPKTRVLACIDVNVYTEAKAKGVNLSAACEAGIISALGVEAPLDEARKAVLSLPLQDQGIIKRCVDENQQKKLRAWCRSIFKQRRVVVTPGQLCRIFKEGT